MLEPWKQKVRQRYDELKKLGKPFFPYIIFKDTLVIFLAFLVIFYLAAAVGANLEEVANPTDTTYNPRPEWYFLFLFQALKFFPGSLEAVAAIILPAMAILFLVILPFIDRGPKRHPLDRPFFTVLGVVALVGLVSLTIMGMEAPMLNPVIHRDPQVMAGYQLYGQLHCNYCHSIQGRGGNAAPDLGTVGARHDRDWLTRHFRDPNQVTPGSVMPQLNLLPEEIDQLVTYLETLGKSEPFTAAAPKLFSENCGACHVIDGNGGEAGPDLTAIRTYRDKAYLADYIQSPQQHNPETAMPGFKGVLTDRQVEDLSRYILSTQRHHH